MKSVLLKHGGRSALPSHRARGTLHGPRARSSPARPDARREGGFTLVEMIAVMTIVAILATVIIGGVVFSQRRARIAATKALLGKLSMAINTYRADYGAYPPNTRPSTGWAGWYTDPGDGLNMPSETLWYFLTGIYEDEDLSDIDRKKMARKSPYIDLREADLKRTGVAFWMNNLDNVKDTPADEYPEIVDAWGSPIHYVSINSLNAGLPKGNPESFDLVVRGPDRLTGPPYDDRDTQVNGKYPNRDNMANFTYE